MLKALGALLLLLCAYRLGSALCRYYTRQHRITCAFCELLRKMQEEIARFRTPFAGILKDDTLCRLFGLDEPPPTFADLVEKNHAFLTEDTAQALLLLEGELGKHFYSEQLELLARTQAQLEKACADLHEQLPRRLRLARFLPIAAALALVLLLI